MYRYFLPRAACTCRFSLSTMTQVLLFPLCACKRLAPPLHAPDIWAEHSLPPDLSHEWRSSVVLSTSNAFRCLISGSLSFVFLSHTWSHHNVGPFPRTLTTFAFDKSSSGWFGFYACSSKPEGPPPSQRELAGHTPPGAHTQAAIIKNSKQND